MAKRKKPTPTAHKLCGKTMSVPPSLCMRCFIAADVKRAVAAERRRVLRILSEQADTYRSNSLESSTSSLSKELEFAAKCVDHCAERVRSERKRGADR
jgi:hypothetical protein